LSNKLLILSQYFPPEIGAPQNRLFGLAKELQKINFKVTVLTALPNYPKMEIQENYKGLKTHFECIDGINTHRTCIYVSHKKGIVPRLRNYFSFVWSSYFYGKKYLDKNYDYILCESPPLFLGITGYLLSRNKKAKFIFNISDLWPESAEKLEIVTNKLLLKSATILEEWLYKKSHLITGQTQGITENIQNRFPNKKIHWLPNGVDLDQFEKPIDSNFRKENNFVKEDILLFYGGILGHAQGLEVILKASNNFKEKPHVKFIIMGTGPEKEKLLNLKEKDNLSQVYFFEPVNKEKIKEVLVKIDASIIPLKNIPLFHGAIPSKIFENLALKKPILLGVDGEAKKLFIEEGKCGYSFEPENSIELTNAINKFIDYPEKWSQLGANGLKLIENRFNRKKIAQEFHQFLIQNA